MIKTKNIYIVISRTPSKFASVIRKAMKAEYNHASIALDEDLNQIYAFARYKKNIPAVAGLVLEHPSRFTLCKDDEVKIKIFKIPVTESEYDTIKNTIDKILVDKEYQYNLFSALTFPLSKGFETYKAYTCVEFVMNMLVIAGIKLDKPTWAYQPQELVEILEEYEVYTGRLLDYRNFEQNPEHEFFDDVKKRTIFKASAAVVGVLMYRYMTGVYRNNMRLLK